LRQYGVHTFGFPPAMKQISSASCAVSPIAAGALTPYCTSKQYEDNKHKIILIERRDEKREEER
jgi:hypothetical protein